MLSTPFLDGQVRPVPAVSGRPSIPSPLLLTRPRAADLAPSTRGGREKAGVPPGAAAGGPQLPSPGGDILEAPGWSPPV